MTLLALRLACAVALVGSLAACGKSSAGHGSSAPVSSASTATTATSAAPKPKPKPKPAAVNPLTGGKPITGRVIAVKIDDTDNGRPPVGLDHADVVYIEQVEGGLTRLLAVFYTHTPPTIGPVRSVRSNDPEILAQYGAIGFVASGGGGDSLPTLDASPLKSDINDRNGPGFFRDGARTMPYDLMLNTSEVPSLGKQAQSIGWTWNKATAQLTGTPTASSLHTVIGGTAVDFAWDAQSGRYYRIVDGSPQHAADGVLLTTPNVIVQFCVGYTNPRDVDVAGNPGHFTKTVGSGKVVVYRNGRKVTGTWSRPTAKAGTVLKDAHGHVIALNPGGAWVLLVTNGTPLS